MYQDWLSSSKRKRHQRAVNKEIRKWNKFFDEDKEYHGLFKLYFIQGFFHLYEDKSGGKFYCTIGIEDNVQHIKYDSLFAGSSNDVRHKLPLDINNYIVNLRLKHLL